VTVSFNPTSMTSYSTYLEANLENTPNSIKPKPVTFEIIGEGNLPRFTIVKPSLRNKKGQSLMLFKRCVVKTNDTQQMVLLNEGTLATKVNFFLFDPDMAFKFKALNANEKDSGIVMKEGEDVISSVIIQPNTQVSFQVTCTPKRVQTYQASLQLTVTDNQFEDTFIQMIGEGYMEDVIFENLHSLAGSIEADEEVLADEDVAAMKCNSISFGDVYINDKKQLLFTMKNQSKSDCYRFEWPTVLQPFILNNASAATIGGLNTSVNTSSANIILNETNNTSQNTASIVNETQNAAIQFSPRIGHLHAGCAKDITVTFKSFEPKQMKKELFTCNLTKIAFEQQINEIKDWDDRLSQVKWVNDTILVPSVLSSVNADQINSSLTFNQQRQLTELGANLPGAVSSAPIKQTIRRKVIETEPEPKHIKIDEQTQPMELYISANCDYCKYKCRTNVIRFKDTLMFQTRVYE
jgi:hydrocephalus-inducing protein